MDLSKWTFWIMENGPKCCKSPRNSVYFNKILLCVSFSKIIDYHVKVHMKVARLTAHIITTRFHTVMNSILLKYIFWYFPKLPKPLHINCNNIQPLHLNRYQPSTVRSGFRFNWLGITTLLEWNFVRCLKVYFIKTNLHKSL